MSRLGLRFLQIPIIETRIFIHFFSSLFFLHSPLWPLCVTHRSLRASLRMEADRLVLDILCWGLGVGIWPMANNTDAPEEDSRQKRP